MNVEKEDMTQINLLCTLKNWANNKHHLLKKGIHFSSLHLLGRYFWINFDELHIQRLTGRVQIFWQIDTHLKITIHHKNKCAEISKKKRANLE